MSWMTKERTIKALQCCAKINAKESECCFECPLRGYSYCIEEMAKCALAFLQDQETVDSDKMLEKETKS